MEHMINGHEYVDLGLPSGVKWATCNVGASSPSDYGDYFAWSETTPKSTYTEKNCKLWEKELGAVSGNPEHDAACANWGGSWRLPSDVEFAELRDLCIWRWATQGGHKGFEVTGPNCNSIFLPAAGCRLGSSLIRTESHGYYLSSTPNESRAYHAYGLYFTYSYYIVDWDRRNCGQSVRPVSE